MAILLLRLCGPMQSWGIQSRFTNRDTGLEPSKSGVIGLLCAALGKPRDDLPSLKELAKLKMGVRIDCPGRVECDYHTAQKVARAGGGKPQDCVISQRFYLADAIFLVALQGDGNLLEKLHRALRNPVWPLYLGRKAFVPSCPVWLKDGFRPDEDDLKTALKSYPYLGPDGKDLPNELRLELEVEYGHGDRVKPDQPESFVSADRRFGLRHVKTTDRALRSELPGRKEEPCISLS